MDFKNFSIDERYLRVPPSKEEQEEWEINWADMIVHLLLRSNDMQSIILALMGDDPPKNAFEYRQARNYLWGVIEKSQPNYGNLNLARSLALKVENRSAETPFGLLAHWVSCAMLSYALDDFDKVFEYALCVQETACQFGSDDILFAGGEYIFGLTMFCLRNHMIPEHKEISPERNARYCQMLLLDDGKESCAQSHGKEMRVLVAAFHELTAQLWQVGFHDGGQRNNLLIENELEPIRQLAFIIDRRTRCKFHLRQWIESFFLQ